MSDWVEAFAGVDRSVAVCAVPAMTLLSYEGVERLLCAFEADFGSSRPIELHNPRCPKWTTRGKRACRCGAAPTEAAFEDELAAMRQREVDFRRRIARAVFAEMDRRSL